MRFYLQENVIFSLPKIVNKTFSKILIFMIHLVKFCMHALSAFKQYTNIFFQFNFIAFQFIILFFFCLRKWHSRFYFLFCLYNADVFVGLKKLWIWEKSSSHCTCYFGTATCSLHISLLRFFSLFYFSPSLAVVMSTCWSSFLLVVCCKE